MIKDKIAHLVTESAESLGYTVYDSSVLLKGENSIIVVKIDSLKGISHNDCEIYSRELSERLDHENILSRYSLEISSPGLNRLLRNTEEFRRFKGSPCKIKYDSDTGRIVIKGIIEQVNDDNVSLETENGIITVHFDNIVNANLDY